MMLLHPVQQRRNAGAEAAAGVIRIEPDGEFEMQILVHKADLLCLGVFARSGAGCSGRKDPDAKMLLIVIIAQSARQKKRKIPVFCEERRMERISYMIRSEMLYLFHDSPFPGKTARPGRPRRGSTRGYDGISKKRQAKENQPAGKGGV